MMRASASGRSSKSSLTVGSSFTSIVYATWPPVGETFTFATPPSTSVTCLVAPSSTFIAQTWVDAPSTSGRPANISRSPKGVGANWSADALRQPSARVRVSPDARSTTMTDERPEFAARS